MKKTHLLHVCLFAIAGIASCGSSIAAQASVSTSPATTLVPAQGVSASSAADRNPFSVGNSTLVTPVASAMVLHEHQLLSQEIQSWVVGNGYKLYWNSKKDYLIYNTISLTGRNDDEILQSLGDIFFSENYGLVVKKYEKNHVIVIDEM